MMAFIVNRNQGPNMINPYPPLDHNPTITESNKEPQP